MMHFLSFFVSECKIMPCLVHIHTYVAHSSAVLSPFNTIQMEMREYGKEIMSEGRMNI
jgi:hypothetical protein